MSNAIMKFDELQNIGRAMVKSGYFEGVKDEAQAIVKILAGNEIGIPPFAAMTGIHVIQSKPVLGANLIASLIKNDPRYNYRVTEHTDTVCDIAFYEDGKQVGTSRVTLDELRKAGSKNLDKYPKNMLFARAISNGAKWHTPGIFGGAPVYTPDEFGLDVDEEGDVIEGQVSEPRPPMPREEAPAKDNGATSHGYAWLIADEIVNNKPHADALAKLLRLAELDEIAQRERVTLYRANRELTDDKKVAAAHAIAGNWLGETEPEETD